MSLDEGPFERAVVFEHAAGYRLICAKRFVAALGSAFEKALINVDLALGGDGPTLLVVARFRSSEDPAELASRFSYQVKTDGGEETALGDLSLFERAKFLTRLEQCAHRRRAAAPAELTAALEGLLADGGFTRDAQLTRFVQVRPESERRAAVRYPLAAPVKVDSGSSVIAVVENLSMTGAFVRTSAPAALNAPVSLELQLVPGELVKAEAVVMNVSAKGMGVRFTPDPGLEKSLADLPLPALTPPRVSGPSGEAAALANQTEVTADAWLSAAASLSGEVPIVSAAEVARDPDPAAPGAPRAIDAVQRSETGADAEAVEETIFINDAEAADSAPPDDEDTVVISDTGLADEISIGAAPPWVEGAPGSDVHSVLDAEADPAPLIEAEAIVDPPVAVEASKEHPAAGPPQPAAPQGVRLGDYELLSMLGRGGMGEVHFGRAVQGPRAGQFVAIKRLPPHLVKDADSVKVLLAEAKTLNLLDHPNIVKAYETCEFEGEHFIVMEALDGRDLGQILRRCKQRKIFLPIDFTCFLLKTWLDALDSTHTAQSRYGVPLNLVHSDVSPHNLFISRSGEIKLGDFGSTRPAGNVSPEVARARGKPSYLSPEALDGEVSVASDLWAVAVTLYEVLWLELPFQGDSGNALMASIREASPVSARKVRPAIPVRLDAVLLKALQKRPSFRYQTAAELGAALTPHFDPQVGTPLAIAAVVGGLFPKGQG